MDWFYALNNEQQGPLAEHELRRLRSDGVIADSTLVWTQGMAAWQPYEKVFNEGTQPTSQTSPPGLSAESVFPPLEATSGKIPSHMVLSIVSLVLSVLVCCAFHCFGAIPVILSVIAIVMASQVSGKMRSGDYAGAMSSSKSARVLSTISLLLTLLFIILIIVFVLLGDSGILNNFGEAQTRSKVARMKADMRSLATGLEAYYVDNGAYPSYLEQVTTPISYLVEVPEDVFAFGDPIRYHAVPHPDDQNIHRWVLWSIGPDGQADLYPVLIEERFALTPDTPELSILDLSFDSTNGVTSQGDIFRVGGSN